MKYLIPLLLLPALSLAEPQWWMKKENAKELSSAIRIGPGSECDFMGPKAKELINVATTRSGVMRSDELTGLYLYVDIQCSEELGEDTFVFSLKVEFIDNITKGRLSAPFRYDLGGYSSLGLGGKDDVISIASYNIDRAIADYVASNPELKED